jgi:hypothetical protein
METIVYRKNKLFCIDKTKLKPAARKDDVCMALYEAIGAEFAGAAYNKNYMNLNPIQRLNAVNEFATNWLDERGLL